MCASAGAPPPNAGWVCTSSGTCERGPCLPGFIDFPPGPPAAGCPCPIEAGEPNDLCATATAAGSVSDTAGSAATITGTLSSASDVDVWTFDTVDTVEMDTNSYHVSIDFTGPAPNDEFRMDVIRGADCADAPSGAAAGITSYDWCVDGKSADGWGGEMPCSDYGAEITDCNDNSAKYYVRVYRKPAASPTCAQYTILVTAQGGDPCDFANQCK